MNKLFCVRILFLLTMAMCSFALASSGDSLANINSDHKSHEQDLKRRIEKSFTKFTGEYLILVRKSNFTLEIINRNNQVVVTYPIAYGRNPDKKAPLYGDDNRTPEGEYKISAMFSKDVDTTTRSYRVLADLNKMYFRAKEGHSKFNHPEIDQGDNAFGPRDYHISYPNTNDIKNYNKNFKEGKIPIVNGKPLPLAHTYDIHGNCDKPSIGHLDTSGCIRMDNDDIIEMEKYVKIGTPIIILAADE